MQLFWYEIMSYYLSGLAPDILKVESWTQMGRTANIIIEYSINVFGSICKNMRILLMGRHYPGADLLIYFRDVNIEVFIKIAFMMQGPVSICRPCFQV